MLGERLLPPPNNLRSHGLKAYNGLRKEAEKGMTLYESLSLYMHSVSRVRLENRRQKICVHRWNLIDAAHWLCKLMKGRGDDEPPDQC